MSKRDEFVEKMKNRLDGWNTEIDNLEEKVQKVKAELKEKYEAQIIEFRKKSEKSEQKLEKIRTAGEGAWENLRGEADRGWNALKDSVNTFKSHFEKESKD